jgi:hypothetical protein
MRIRWTAKSIGLFPDMENRFILIPPSPPALQFIYQLPEKSSVQRENKLVVIDVKVGVFRDLRCWAPFCNRLIKVGAAALGQ